jgi:Tol biopolymer transport system component
MGLPEKSRPPEAYSLSQAPTEQEPVPPPDWPAESASFQPPEHYVVVEALGNGGMGVLYKAEDTRLHRTVALKVLPLRFTNDPVAKERFLREARTASALDHQNICAIFDVGESEDGRLFLAMPCYQGETLRARLARGPLPPEEALGIAKQVARGLAKAHRLGIVHRDIKPENLMLTTDGVVKILDFGIAKLAGASDLTGTEHRIGTPSYMAPEQSRKGTVDSRADLWALGVVLYEMITGRRPFRGPNPVVVLQAIQYGVPEPISELRSGVPPRLEKVVARLLMKNPKARYPDAESVLEELDLETAAAGRRSRRAWLSGGIAATLGIGLIAAWTLSPADRQGTAAVLAASPERLTNQPGIEWFPSLSADGKRFAYSRLDGSDYDIYVQSLGRGSAVNLTPGSPADDLEPAFSADGYRIAFRSDREGGGIFVMSSAGGPARQLTRFGFSPSWSPDGETLLVATAFVEDPKVYGRSSRIWKIDVATGRRQLLVPQEGVQPSWSPNGNRIAFWGVDRRDGSRRIWTVDADGGNAVSVTRGDALDWNPVWSADGHLYFASNRGGPMGLWRIAVDEETGTALGAAEPIPTPSSRVGFLSVSRDGRRILYASQVGSANVERADLDPDAAAVTGPLAQVTRGARNVLQARVSPDGDHVVITDVNEAEQEDLYLVRADGAGEPLQITRDAHKERAPTWSPDGRRILFSSNRQGRYETWTIAPDGSGPRPLEMDRRQSAFQALPSPDGRWLACVLPPAYAAALVDMKLPPARRTPRMLGPDGSRFYPWSWSPDGKRLAGVDREGGLVLYSPATESFARVTGRGWRPVWMRTRPKLLFLDERSKVLALDLETRATSVVLEPAPTSSFLDLDLGPDDRTLYVVNAASEGDIWMLTLD